jgi:hypothetical protein
MDKIIRTGGRPEAVQGLALGIAAETEEKVFEFGIGNF